jgi:SAM-dependent methyltransferase
VEPSHWNARYAAAERVWPGDPNVWVRESVEQLAPGRAIDVAAGEGRHALWLASLGWRVDAVDFSAVALERGQALAAARGLDSRITWVEADVVTSPPEAGAYDLAVVAYLHLASGTLRAVLRAVAAGLAPGGTLVVVGHDAANVVDGVGGPTDPTVLYTPADVEAHLANTGLTFTRAETVRRAALGSDRAALDAVVTAVRPSRTP